MRKNRRKPGDESCTDSRGSGVLWWGGGGNVKELNENNQPTAGTVVDLCWASFTKESKLLGFFYHSKKNNGAYILHIPCKLLPNL